MHKKFSKEIQKAFQKKIGKKLKLLILGKFLK